MVNKKLLLFLVFVVIVSVSIGVFNRHQRDLDQSLHQTIENITGTTETDTPGNKKFEPSVGYFSYGNKCPTGWTDLGQTGIWYTNAPSTIAANYPPEMNKGGWSGSDGWTWMHPRVCKGKKSAGNLEKLWKFADKTENPTYLTIGVIESRTGRAPYPIGGGYNSAWSWMHPGFVPASTPGGHSIQPRGGDAVTIGILEDRSVIRNKFGSPGSALNDGWFWTHPTLQSDK